MSRAVKMSILAMIIGLPGSLAVSLLISHLKLDTTATYGNVMGAFAGIVIAIAALWLDILRSSDATAETLNTMRRQADQNMRTVVEAYQLASEIAIRADRRDILSRLSIPAEGIERARRILLLNQANNNLKFCRIQLSDYGNEDARIELLGEVVRYATEYVYAYTYATPHNIRAFWTTRSAEKYLDEHREALRRCETRLERIFVIPDNLEATDISAHQRLNLILKGFRDRGVAVHAISESRARFLLLAHGTAFCERGFMVADDTFLSEADQEINKETNAPRRAGYVSFASREGCLTAKAYFDQLLNAIQTGVPDDWRI